MTNKTYAPIVADDHVDGRTARRDRNKTAVLDSVIDLFAEGNLTPGVHEVAARSDVSLRSVYRYFEDVDDLVTAAIARHMEKASHLFEIPDIGVGSTTDRIDTFCSRRVNLFTSLRAVFTAARIRAAEHRGLADGIHSSRERLGDQTAAMFAPELDAMDECRSTTVATTLDALSQFETLEYVYRRQSSDADGTAHFLRLAFTEILC